MTVSEELRGNCVLVALHNLIIVIRLYARILAVRSGALLPTIVGSHLVVQGILFAHRHMSNDERPLACVFCGLELLDHEREQTVGVRSSLRGVHLLIQFKARGETYCWVSLSYSQKLGET